MVFSLVFYNAILLLSTLFVWLSEKASTPMQRKVCTLIAFLIVFLPAALRYEIGIDYFSYKIIFENIRDGLDPFWQSKMEPGYYFLNWVVAKLGGGFESLIILIAFLITIIFFKSYPNKYKAVFHIILWSVVYFETFNTLRSMLAGALLLHATMDYSREHKLYKYFVLVSIATAFHKSAILFFIIPFLIQKNLFQSAAKIRVLFPLLIILNALFGQVIIELAFNNSLTAALGYSKYVDSWYNKDVELGTGLGVFLILFIFTYALILASKSLKKENYILMMVVLLAAISVALASHVTIFYRVKLLFIIGFPLVAFLILNSSKKQSTIAIVIVFIALNVFNFNRSITNGSTDYIETCRGARITPYVSILNKDDSTRDPHLTRFARWCDAYFEKN